MMNAKTIKLPNPDHPITIEPTAGRVTVTIAGRVVADSRSVLTMREASYPPVYYIPRADVEMCLFERTDHASYCPYKGDCSYFSFAAEAERVENALWTYEAPYQSVAAIQDHVAFYTDRVEAITFVPVGMSQARSSAS